MDERYVPGSKNIERSGKNRFVLAPLLLVLCIASCGGHSGDMPGREVSAGAASDAIPVVPVAKCQPSRPVQ